MTGTTFRKKAYIILVVDDNAEMLSLIGSVLELDAHRVITAESGIEALELLAKITPPDLILLDVRMEAMSGPEFLQVLEQKMPEIIKNVPVVLLTGMDVVPITRAVGAIRKPFDIHGFLAKIIRYIEMGPPPISDQREINN